MSTKPLPNRLPVLRAERRMTQRRLGRLANPRISQTRISEIENGARMPSAAELRSLAKALGCDISEIINEVAS